VNGNAIICLPDLGVYPQYYFVKATVKIFFLGRIFWQFRLYALDLRNFHVMRNLSRDVRRAAGVFFLRALLGMVIFLQGYVKIFSWGLGAVYDNIFKPLEAAAIPLGVLQAMTFVSSYTELVGGLMLLLGLLRQYVYLLLGGLLLLLAFGQGLLSPAWEMDRLYFTGSMLAALLLLPAHWDTWCLDRFTGSNGKEE